jgi:uncharacterized delta-60 repeat protein
MTLSRWQRSPRQTFSSRRIAHSSRRPALEALEDRTLPSAGALDPTFGTGGVVQGGSGFNSSASTVAVEPDGKVLVAGTSSEIDTSQLIVSRYTKAGVLDTTFGTGGAISLNFNLGAETFNSASGLVVQSDGKILVAGTASSLHGPSQFALARLNADGTFDSTFGTKGLVLTSFNNAGSNFRVDASASAVALQSDGKIVVAGSATYTWLGKILPPSGFTLFTDFAVARYDASGHLDKGFGNGGEVVTSFGHTVPGHGQDHASGIVVQKDGKIVVAGTAIGETPPFMVPVSNVAVTTSQLALARYTTDGSLDRTFGTNGLVLTSVANALQSTAAGVVLTSDGKIVVAGTARGRFTLARYTTAGKLDSTFGTNGIVTTVIAGTASSSASGLVLTPQGQIVVAGSAVTSGNRSVFALARYTANGTLDSHFGKNGTVLTPIGTSATASAITVQADGKLVVAGGTWGGVGGRRFAVARYLGDPIVTASGAGIEGVALVGPISPVSRPGVPNYRPLAGAILSILSADGGTELARVVADSQGRFHIHLVPGRYKLIPLPLQPGEVYPRGTPQIVVVQPGSAYTEVTVMYFSGIV